MQSKTLTLVTLFAVLLGVLACGGGATPTAAPTPPEAAPPTAAIQPTDPPKPTGQPAAGRRDRAWLERVAAHPVRHNDVYVMPAHGLCLERVGYPPDDQLADRAEQARSLRTPQEVDR